MYYCENCHRHFDALKVIEEGYGMPWPWRRQYDACPLCGIADLFTEVDEDAT